MRHSAWGVEASRRGREDRRRPAHGHAGGSRVRDLPPAPAPAAGPLPRRRTGPGGTSIPTTAIELRGNPGEDPRADHHTATGPGRPGTERRTGHDRLAPRTGRPQPASSPSCNSYSTGSPSTTTSTARTAATTAPHPATPTAPPRKPSPHPLEKATSGSDTTTSEPTEREGPRRAGPLHDLGIGAHNRGKRVLALIDETTVTVIRLDTGEILSTHDIDHTRSYWRNTQHAESPRPMARG